MTVRDLFNAARGTGHTPVEADNWMDAVTTASDYATALVFYGDNAATARPAVDGPVHWLGYTGVVPVNAVDAADVGTVGYFDLVTTVEAPVAATVPDAPTIGTATAGDGQATFAFTPPANDGGSAITIYTVTTSPGGLTATGPASPLTVTGLTNGTAYTGTVVATNSVGNSAPSAASNSVTPQAASVAPDAPTGLSATGGDGQVSLTWTASAGADGHRVYRHTANDFALATQVGTDLGAAANSYLDTTAVNDTTYYYWIVAFNAVGESGPSTSATATPTAAPAGIYTTDFSEYTTGQTPADWSRPWSDNVTFTVQEDATAKGGKRLNLTAAEATNFSILVWDAVDDADRDNVDILVRFRVTNVGTGTGASLLHFGGRISGTPAGGNQNGYWAGLRNFDNNTRAIKLVNGAFASLQESAFTWTTSVWYFQRVRIEGTSVKLRSWAGAVGDEPATWAIDQTDTSVSGVGGVCVMIGRAGVVADVDWFSVATGGQTAPAVT